MGFGLCLLGIFDVVPPLVIAAIAAVFLLFYDRQVVAKVDYSLLGTFIAFFIFIGNLGSVAWFKAFIASVLEGHVVAVSVLASQVISNVPAALLLSGFTTDWQGLLIGCNLGGLGTLIASMASLISYKLVAQNSPRTAQHLPCLVHPVQRGHAGIAAAFVLDFIKNSPRSPQGPGLFLHILHRKYTGKCAINLFLTGYKSVIIVKIDFCTPVWKSVVW